MWIFFRVAYSFHYSWFDWHWSGNGQNMNFGFWKKNLAQIIADYVYFHMVYHTFIWNHCGCHRRVLNMTHFQLFAWFIQTLLVRKMGKVPGKMPTLVSTNMISNECMIYHMKVHIVSYNLGKKNFKNQNSYFTYVWTNGHQNSYSDMWGTAFITLEK